MKNDLLNISKFPRGKLNLITDVSNIKVGHFTLSKNEIQTGITIINIHNKNYYLNKIPAGLTVINGFGKSVGLMQIKELGNFETPIALTNTFAVPSIMQAQIKQAILDNPEIGRNLPTINPLVFECNDGYLNNIQEFSIKPKHYNLALKDCKKTFKLGSVGAGRGMSAFGLKGGIGSASRLLKIDNKNYTLGCLVLANFGVLDNLILNNKDLEKKVKNQIKKENINQQEKGSIIIVLATDCPLDSRQLTRISKRAEVGLALTGSVLGNGSGDISLAFSTAYTIPQINKNFLEIKILAENNLDIFFQTTAEVVQESIISALLNANEVVGRNNNKRLSLLDFI